MTDSLERYVRAGTTEAQARAMLERHGPLSRRGFGWRVRPDGIVEIDQDGQSFLLATNGAFIRSSDGLGFEPDPNPTRARPFMACPACGDPTGVRCCEFGADR